MGEKYDEIMNKIEVTDEMRQRILENIQKTDMTATRKIVRFPQWKRYISIAACFAVVLVGVLVAPTLLRQPSAPPVQSENPSGPVQGGSPTSECASLDELSQAVGFSVSELTNLPFEIESTAYTSYWDKMAQIEYASSEGNRATYRKSVGTDDNSGQYAAFTCVKEVMQDDLSIVLKGEADQFVLAVWTDGVYGYSILLSEGISESAWLQIISAQVSQ